MEPSAEVKSIQKHIRTYTRILTFHIYNTYICSYLLLHQRSGFN